MDIKLNASQQGAFTFTKANGTLDRISQKPAKKGRSKEVILPLYSIGEAVPGYCLQFWKSQYKGDMDILKIALHKVTKMIKEAHFLSGEGEKIGLEESQASNQCI